MLSNFSVKKMQGWGFGNTLLTFAFMHHPSSGVVVTRTLEGILFLDFGNYYGKRPCQPYAYIFWLVNSQFDVCTSLAPRLMTVFFGLETRLHMRMHTLENGVLRNGQQLGRAVNQSRGSHSDAERESGQIPIIISFLTCQEFLGVLIALLTNGGTRLPFLACCLESRAFHAY